jgi:GT2 family glycosyltransferase
MASKNSTIYFVVVNFNNYLYTVSLCKSLSKQIGIFKKFDVKCIVVDNSTDTNDSRLLAEFSLGYPWIKISSPGKNLGYFAGLNHGLVQLNQLEPEDFVVIGNNDLEFEDDFCLKISSSKYQDNVFAVCPSVITPQGYNQNPHILERISDFRRFQFDVFFSHYFFAYMLLLLKSLFRRIRPQKKSSNQVARELHMGIGACYILTDIFFKHFSELNCLTFLYGEEAFFSEQVHSKCGILYFDPSLKVFHAESATLSKIPKRKSYEYAREGYPLYRKLM